MERFPVEPRKRRKIEFGIRLIDICCYAVVFLSGVFASLITPTNALLSLKDYEWMIGIWAGLLIVGGALGLIGRITTIWLIEPAADVASAFGIAIYFVIIFAAAQRFSVTTALVTGLVLMAFLGIVRRYLELQLFGSEPEQQKNFRKKLQTILDRRIPDAPPRG